VVTTTQRDPAKPYVLELADRAGTFGVWYAATFDELLETYLEVSARHPLKVAVFGNWNRADFRYDGLTDAECERLQEFLTARPKLMGDAEEPREKTGPALLDYANEATMLLLAGAWIW
jgi:hypothetical protein